MADNPAYDGEEKWRKRKIFENTHKRNIFKFQEKKEAEEETLGFWALVKYGFIFSNIHIFLNFDESFQLWLCEITKNGEKIICEISL